MAAEGGIITFIFNGEDRNDIPQNVTHLIIHENITVIPRRLFYKHPNLVEVYCHKGVTKIEESAFYYCQSLRRVIIPGVTIIERWAFINCRNLVYVECVKLERIGVQAFNQCKSLSSIDLPSAKIVEESAFYNCPAMTQAIFGKDLESIEGIAFVNCVSLESITIPLRNGLLTGDDIFRSCVNLKRVDLIEDEALRNFADALLLEDWRNDVNEVLDSINQILPNTAAGDNYNVGGKAIAIREWIGSVRREIIHYKAAHRESLNEAATVLHLFLPNDTVINNVLPFVELPVHTFGVGDEVD